MTVGMRGSPRQYDDDVRQEATGKFFLNIGLQVFLQIIVLLLSLFPFSPVLDMTIRFKALAPTEKVAAKK
jgi:hypothetical protein